MQRSASGVSAGALIVLSALLATPAAASTASITGSTTATVTILPGPLSISLAADPDPLSTKVVFGDARAVSSLTGWAASVVATVEVSRVGGVRITRSVA